nr:MAG TPA: hypothetical protein [Caudoviricetes sp.]
MNISPFSLKRKGRKDAPTPFLPYHGVAGWFLR